jgi:tetratricopeptide (TPR) repeat protein
VFPVIGFFLCAAYLFLNLAERWRYPAYGVMILLAVGWGGVSRANNVLWGDEGAYLRYWLNESPEFKAIHFHLADYHYRRREFSQARHHYLQGLTRQKPDVIRVLAQCGLMDLAEGRLDRAEKEFQKVLELKPSHAPSLNNLGAIHLRRGEVEQARIFFIEALRADPMFVLPRLNLAAIFRREGKIEERRRVLEEALRIDPANAAVLRSLKNPAASERSPDG